MRKIIYVIIFYVISTYMYLYLCTISFLFLPKHDKFFDPIITNGNFFKCILVFSHLSFQPSFIMERYFQVLSQLETFVTLKKNVFFLSTCYLKNRKDFFENMIFFFLCQNINFRFGKSLYVPST